MSASEGKAWRCDTELKMHRIDTIKGIVVCMLVCFVTGTSADVRAENLSCAALEVHENSRYFVCEDGRPFFWLADTAWQLIHDLDKQQVDKYFANRAKKGFTVIQTVILAEYDGLDKPNAYGHFVLESRDPAKPIVKDGPGNDYWDHVEYVLSRAGDFGLYVGLLPTWGRYVTSNWQNGIVDGIFNEENAGVYGEFVGRRFRDHSNIIWIIGGDRAAPTDDSRAIWRAMAKGVTVGVCGEEDYDKTLMTYHTSGPGASWWFFNDEKWIDIRSAQSGHGQNSFNWQLMQIGYSMKPTKPMLDLETAYPGFRHGRPPTVASDDHARRGAYWSVFAGACGHTYGHHSIWQMHDSSTRAIANPKGYWYEVLDVPSAFQMGHLRKLMESRPFVTAVPDQSMILTEQNRPDDYIEAIRGDGFAMIYTPTGKKFAIRTDKIEAEKLTACWFNPRTGKARRIGHFKNRRSMDFDPPGREQFANDWVLILDDAGKGFIEPGR
jgi:hypothetical protein